MIRTILLDLDGTVFRGKTAIPGAERTLEQLRLKGIKLFFITNANNKTRGQIVEKLKTMGIKAFREEIFSSAYATANYVSVNHPGKRVLCISSGGIQDELREKGISVVEDDSADVVVVGFDPTLTYDKLATAFRAISKGALFIATNQDATFPVEDGFLPGAGAMVAAVQYSTKKAPIVIGKPNKYGIELLLKENKLKKQEVLIVGDRIETDVRTGKLCSIKSALVLTGVAKKEDLKKLKKEEKPDFVLESLNELFSIL